eukprot:CAMPEP_0179200298 /NCGR_PEP_ID=MMETSP0796-20121207/99682_1 /TAXON_ID=73915 /ORGANISM="Pyrodinium bahamense, Strain pbaha01" /LENGTH=230 /DNA_ID=CAMNT_0020904853 /DNA_START=15 /DNA_END=707 /DNA_ORIENTATION=-
MATKSVLVMEFVAGTPLSRLEKEARRRGIELEGMRKKILGESIVRALTTAFGRMVFSSGFIHGDPHPGNLILQAGYLAQVVRDFGVTFAESVEDEDAAAASVALFLFGDRDAQFPGGYSNKELDANSPLRALASFPQELVLLGRASVIIRGIGARFGVKVSTASAWRSLAEQTCKGEVCALPAWALEGADMTTGPTSGTSWKATRARVSEALAGGGRLLGEWVQGKVKGK